MSKSMHRLLTVMIAVATVFSALSFVTGFETVIKSSAEDIPRQYVVPDYNFASSEPFLGNSLEKKPRWCTDNDRASRDTSLSSELFLGGKAALIDNTSESPVSSLLFVDLYDQTALPPGDYILQCFVKLENVTKPNPNAGDQGFRLRVINWKADDSGLDWDGANDIRGQAYDGSTEGFKFVELPFTVPEGVSTVRIAANLNYCTGKAWVTRFTIKPASMYYHIRNNSFELDDNYVYDAGPAYAVDGEKWGAWTNFPINAEKPWSSYFAIDDTVAHSGSKSLRLTLPTNQEVINVKYGSLIKVVPGRDYTVSCWVKTDNVVRRAGASATDQGAYIQLAFFNEENTNIVWPSPDLKSPNALDGTKDWTKIVYTFTVPEGVSRVQIMPSATNCTGTVWFDDIEFGPASNDQPDLPEVANPNFDTGTTFMGSGIDSSIRYAWGFWYGELATGGGPIAEQPNVSDALSIAEGAGLNGKNAAKIVALQKGIYQLRQVVGGIDEGIEYVLRGKVKLENVTSGNGGAYLRVGFLKPNGDMIWEVNGSNITSQYVKEATNDYQEIYVKFRLPSDAKDLVVMPTVDSLTATVYFTDLELMPAVFYEEPSEEPGDDDNEEPGDNDNEEPGNNDNDPKDPGKDGNGNPRTGENSFSLYIAVSGLIALAYLIIFRKRITIDQI